MVGIKGVNDVGSRFGGEEEGERYERIKDISFVVNAGSAIPDLWFSR